MILKAQIEPSRPVNIDGRTNIKIKFSKNRVRRLLPTKFYIEPELFDQRTGTVKKFHPQAKAINLEIKKIILDYETKLIPINYENWTTGQIFDYLKGDNGADGRFFPFFREVIKLKKKESRRNGELYEAALAKTEGFEPNKALHVNQINPQWLRRFESHMKEQGLQASSIGIHLRILRAVYNAAIDEGIVDISLYPFRRFKIRAGVSNKRALTIQQIKAIRDYRGGLGATQHAAAVFMASFYMIGANTGDLWALKDISEGRAWYRRKKTERVGEVLSVKIEPEAAAMIGKLQGLKRVFSLADDFKKVTTLTSQLNTNLKVIGAKIGVPSLTMYHARHSWATLAATEIEPPATTEEIGRALGHKEKGVTSGYITRGYKRTDQINRAVLDLLK